MWALGLLAALRSGQLSVFKRRLFGSLRAAVYVAMASASLVVVLAARADAQLQEQSRSLSQELLPLSDLLAGATALSLNGEAVSFSMTTLEGTSVKQVLDRVQAQCEKNPGPLAKQSLELIRGLPKALPGASAAAELLTRLVVTRQEDRGQGAVLCFTGDGSASNPNFAEDFERTHDLAALGRLRYVMAGQGRDARSEPHSTRVISLWTEGPLRLDRLAPPEGEDAPGGDSASLPRFPGSVRVLSAVAIGAPYSVRVYETEASSAQVLAYYDAELAAFEQLTLQGSEDTGRAYLKELTPLLLQLTRRGSKTVITLAELGGTEDLQRLGRGER